MHSHEDIVPMPPPAAGPNRRTFLQAGAAATAAMAVSGPLGAQQKAPVARRGIPKITVVLFQRGGADHLNIYAPTGDPNYAVLRPTIGLRPPGSTTGVVGLAMNPTFSMHPSMTGIHAAFTAPGSHFGVVHAVGYQPYNRSHFTSQDIYETAMLGPAAAEGWLNRHLQATATPQDPPVRALAISGSLPRSMFGLYPCYAVASTQDLVFGGAADQRLYLETIVDQTPTGGMPSAHQLAYESGRNCFDLIDMFSGLAPLTYVPANGAVYPAGALGKALREIAEVIKANVGIEFFAVDQGGWDHHSSLVTRIATYATEFDRAVTAFFTDIGALASDVLLVSMSEFGRTAAENGSGGTDHGAGGAMLVAGGNTIGGQLHGVWPGLASSGYLTPSNDFRDVLREVLELHMGGTDPNFVFPGRTYVPIGVL